MRNFSLARDRVRGRDAAGTKTAPGDIVRSVGGRNAKEAVKFS
jgi:hypothetical protein